MKNRSTIRLTGAILLGAILLLAACSKNENTKPKPVNNYLVSAAKAGDVTKEFLQSGLAYNPDYAKYATLPKTNVTLYRVSYSTQYPAGKKITASGVFFIPDTYNTSLPTMIYTHGTIDKGDTPSLNLASPLNYTDEVTLCAVACSSFGCAVLMPDYVGYGDSQAIVHPYIHGESLGQASFDLVEAFGEYAAEESLPFDGHILITGYSEGGYAAVALQKKVQETPASGLNVVKTVAGSGPYDNEVFAQELLQKTEALDPSVIATYLWAMEMYKTDFGYSKSYDQIFSDVDNALLRSAGYDMAYLHTLSVPSLDTDPSRLFRPGFIDGVVGKSDAEFTGILKANSLTDFVPADSLIFVCGSTDDWVYPSSTLNTFSAMTAKHCKVKMYELSGGDHETTMPYYLDILLGRLQSLQ